MKIQKMIAGSIVILCIGVILGGKLEEKSSENKMVETVDKIAIVNLDEGVSVNDEKVNYANALLANIEGDYVAAGATEAREGIYNGTYGAYIVIPSNFSESIVSINTTPEKAILEYAMNPYLEENTAISVLEMISRFQNTMNTNVAYMYVEAILDEFHQVQDDAVTIMENDVADLNRLESVNPEDLMVSLTFSEIKPIDSNIETLDLSAYYETNEKNLDLLYTELQGQIAEGEAQFDSVKNQNDQVQLTMAGVLLNLIKINPIMENDQYVFQDGMNTLDSYFAAHNGNVEANKTTLTQNINTMLDSQLTYNQTIADTAYYNCITSCEEQANQQLAGIIESYNENLQGEIKDYARAVAGTAQAKEYNRIVDMVNGDVMVPDEEAEDDLTLWVQKVNTLITYLHDNGDDGISDEELAQITEDISAIQDIEPQYIEQEQLESIWEGDDLKADVSEYITWQEYDSAIVLPEEEIPAFQETVKIMMTDQGGIQLEKLEDNVVAEAVQEISDDYTLSMEIVSDTVEKEIVEPILKKNTQDLKTVAESALVMSYSMAQYETSIGEYNPYAALNQDLLNMRLGAIKTNTAAMQNQVANQQEISIDYAVQVYDTANENMAWIQEDWNQAVAISNVNIENCISRLKHARNQINSENVQMLEAFTKKLPYTRMGSIGYKEAYDFIVNPINMQGISIWRSNPAETDGVYETYLWAVMLTASVILAGVVIFDLCRKRAYKKEQ